MPTIEQAIFLATMAHEGQKDRADQPYILHLLRVMLSVDTEEERIVALLHDIVEDTEITLTTFEKLADYGFSLEVIEAVKHLTKQPGEEYIDYIQRVEQPSRLRILWSESLLSPIDRIRVTSLSNA